jgi:hypothetical protein
MGLMGLLAILLKRVSKSPFFRDANKDWQNGLNGRMPI